MGYVYAFHNKPCGLLKVGMTDRSDESSCWGRIRDYVLTHNLSSTGWEFVGFVASKSAAQLEQSLHRKLAKFRFMHASARELFKCSVSIYLAALDQFEDMIEAGMPDNAPSATYSADTQQAQEDMLLVIAAKVHMEQLDEYARRNGGMGWGILSNYKSMSLDAVAVRNWMAYASLDLNEACLRLRMRMSKKNITNPSFCYARFAETPTQRQVRTRRVQQGFFSVEVPDEPQTERERIAQAFGRPAR